MIMHGDCSAPFQYKNPLSRYGTSILTVVGPFYLHIVSRFISMIILIPYGKTTSLYWEGHWASLSMESSSQYCAVVPPPPPPPPPPTPPPPPPPPPPLRPIREIEGFATHIYIYIYIYIYVTREMRAVFRDAYMRHQAKMASKSNR